MVFQLASKKTHHLHDMSHSTSSRTFACLSSDIVEISSLPSWDLFNPFQQGFFRVQYGPEYWQHIQDTLNSANYKVGIYNSLHV